ncbi:hypothetical protein LJK88_34140 [Paenibacillus sp. P26]|nr:hypothetical protein LJK88_34140 [Paenibacillus sp. P26]
MDHKRGYLNQIYATDLSTLTAFGYELQQGGPSELDNTIILSYGATMGCWMSRRLRAQGFKEDIEGTTPKPATLG